MTAGQTTSPSSSSSEPPAISVRRFFITDDDELTAAVRASLPELSRWMPWATNDFSRSDASDFISGSNSPNRMDLAILDENDMIIGVSGVNHIDTTNRTANLGYWVRSDRTQRGVASVAARLGAKRAVEERQINRFEITMSVENVPSRRTAERLGAQFEGIARNSLLLHNRFHDARVYSLMASELDQLPAPPSRPWPSKPSEE